MDSGMLKMALYYREKLGLSIIPVKKDKKPLIKWEEFQKRKASSDEIKHWFRQYTSLNIAIVTGSISGICVVDVDTPEGKDQIGNYIPDSLECPTCTTPRGGIHYYFRLPEQPLSNNVGVIPGCDFRGEGGYVVAPPSDNGNGKAYQWLHGTSLLEIAIPDLPESYISYVKTHLSTNSETNVNACTKYAHEDIVNCKDGAKKLPLFAEGRRDNDLFHIANALVKNKTPLDDVAKLLKICIKSWGERPDQKWINDKIASAIKRIEKKERNLSQEVFDWVLSTNGHFLSTDVHKCLEVSTREDKKNTSEILRRLIEDGIIERYGDKNGCFRKIDFEAPDIDFVHADEKPIPFRWPFGIEQYFNLMQKNIVIVAGEPDAGKSAFLLNVVKLNMDRYKIYYFSSEMGPAELKSRMMGFDYPLDCWHFHAKERSVNFQDVIRPNDINIIDFMEISDNFYQIGGWIRAIFDKLQNGIAIIALQKPRGRDEGRGGEITKEKARLYLSMGHGKIKIVKAKNWVHSQINPKDMECEFKLVNGCNFIPQTTWQKPIK